MKEQKREEFGLLELISFIGRALPSLVLFVSVVGTVTYWRYSANPSYTADGVLQVESSRSNRMQAVTEKLVTGGRGGQMSSDSDQLIDKYFMIFSSRDFNVLIVNNLIRDKHFDEVADAYSTPTHKITDAQQLTDKILETVAVYKTSSETFRMSLSLSSPEKTVRALNLMMDYFSAAVVERDSQDLSDTKTFLENQIKEIDKRLGNLDDMIADVKETRRRQKASLGVNSSREAGTEEKLEQASFAFRQQLNEVRDMISVAEQQVKDSKETSYLPTDKYGSLASLENLRRKERLLDLRYSSTQKLLEAIRKTPDASLRDERAVQDLYKRKELEYQLFTDLKKEVMNIDIQRISVQNKIHVLDRPTLGGVRTGETLKPLMVKRCLFAVILAIFFSFLRDAYNPLIKGRKELTELGMVYMGSVPDLHKRRRLLSIRDVLVGFIAKIRGRKQIPSAENNAYFEMVFRNICGRVMNYRPENKMPPRVISVMSATSREGKTTISRNLSRAFAKSGKRTLVVDCDLHRRSLSIRQDLGTKDGVSDYLEDTRKVFQPALVKQLEKNLDMLPAGHSKVDPMELLSSAHFAEFVEAMKHYYDVIIIDTPPVVPCSESISIANVSDLVLVSVIAGGTKISHVDEMLEKLRFSLNGPMAYVMNFHEEAQAFTYYEDYSKLNVKLSRGA